MRLLVVNPNTSRSVSERLRVHVAASAPAGADVRVATAAFGASYISDEASFAVAGHAALDAWARDGEEHGEADAVLVGCFGDPGLEALRERSPVPVEGLADAAMREAAAHGRFSIVTGGAAWKPMLERIARGAGHGAALVHVETVAATGAQLAADPDAAVALLRDACRAAARGADCVLLGGAGLAGLAARVSVGLGVPLVDSVEAGARALVASAARPRAVGAAATPSPPLPPSSASWRGLSASLMRRFA